MNPTYLTCSTRQSKTCRRRRRNVGHASSGAVHTTSPQRLPAGVVDSDSVALSILRNRMWCAPVLCRRDAVATEKPVGCYARIAPPDFACGTPDIRCSLMDTFHIVVCVHIWCDILWLLVKYHSTDSCESYHYLVTNYFVPSALLDGVW